MWVIADMNDAHNEKCGLLVIDSILQMENEIHSLDDKSNDEENNMDKSLRLNETSLKSNVGVGGKRKVGRPKKHKAKKGGSEELV